MALQELTINHEEIIPDSAFVNEVRNILESIDRKIPGNAYRKSVIEKLEVSGWSGKVPIHHDSRASIDGIRNNVGIVVQLGIHGAGVLPIFNLEYLYIMKKISAGIFITQTHAQAVQRHSLRNPGVNSDGNYISFERLEPDLRLYAKFLKCPIRVLAMDE